MAEAGAAERAGTAEGARITADRQLFEQVLHAHQRLQVGQGLEGLFDFLLVELPERLGLTAAELQFVDRDGELAELLPASARERRPLALGVDAFELESLYSSVPQVEVLDPDDERMFRILAWDEAAGSAVLMPLIEAGELVGSYHWGLPAQLREAHRGDLELLRSLTRSLSAAFSRVRLQALADRFTLLDPVTGVGNQRAFRRGLARELARAHRFGQPLTLLLASLDAQGELAASYGEAACQFALKRVVQRLSSTLRESDYLARIAEDRLAALLPACAEPHGHDTAERMCADIGDFAIDDGRGGSLHSTLSVGVVTWNPAQLPSEDLKRLGVLLQAEAESGLAQAVLGGGNRVALARLGALMV